MAVARGLSRCYAVGSAVVRALDRVDLDIAAGEFVCLTGRSGSGKSTLLHLLGGLDRPSEGSVAVGGRDLGSLTSEQRALYRRREVGFVFQAFHLIPSMTAEQNVALALTIQGAEAHLRRDLAREALRRLGMGARAGHRPSQLSGGEQQRVALARAIVHRPRLLLADEPTGNLDRANAEAVMELLCEINGEFGTTVVLATHDEESAGRLRGRVLRLRDGGLEGARGR